MYYKFGWNSDTISPNSFVQTQFEISTKCEQFHSDNADEHSNIHSIISGVSHRGINLKDDLVTKKSRNFSYKDRINGGI